MNSSQTTGRGTIRGRVIDGQGRPVVEAVVMIVGDSPSHLDIAALTGEAGEYSYTGLWPGRYTLLVNAPAFSPQQDSVEVTAGQESRLDLMLI